MARKSTAILRDKNKEFASTYKNVFEHLRKELLKEIKDKNVCVCGRSLDDESIKKIDGLIGVMPPDSYDYQFGQFVSKAKHLIREAEVNIMSYDRILREMSQLRKEISNCEFENKEQEQELLNFDKSNEYTREFEDNKTKLKELNNELKATNGVLINKKFQYDKLNKALNNATANNKISNIYSYKINFFRDLKALLEQEKEIKIQEVKKMLNLSVKNVFKQLTTQSPIAHQSNMLFSKKNHH